VTLHRLLAALALARSRLHLIIFAPSPEKIKKTKATITQEQALTWLVKPRTKLGMVKLRVVFAQHQRTVQTILWTSSEINARFTSN
jgi:hypothetical protein